MRLIKAKVFQTQSIEISQIQTGNLAVITH